MKIILCFYFFSNFFFEFFTFFRNQKNSVGEKTSCLVFFGFFLSSSFSFIFVSFFLISFTTCFLLRKCFLYLFMSSFCSSSFHLFSLFCLLLFSRSFTFFLRSFNFLFFLGLFSKYLHVFSCQNLCGKMYLFNLLQNSLCLSTLYALIYSFMFCLFLILKDGFSFL